MKKIIVTIMLLILTLNTPVFATEQSITTSNDNNKGKIYVVTITYNYDSNTKKYETIMVIKGNSLIKAEGLSNFLEPLSNNEKERKF